MRYFMFICLFLLTACIGKPVTVIDEADFSTMAVRIPDILKDYGLIDKDGSYIVSHINAQPKPNNAGELLFKRLNSSFRFNDGRKISFADSKVSNDSIEINENGFIMGQGVNVITVNLVSIADFNNDTKPDWFIVCNIKSVLDNSERDYYLVVEDISAQLLDPTLLAVYDCKNQRCTVYIGNDKFKPESNVIEVKAGQRNITTPPKKVNLKDENSSIKEQKLSN